MSATIPSESVLAARHLLYAQFQALLGSKPTAEALAAVDADLLGEAFLEVGLAQPRALIDALHGAADAMAQGDDSLADAYTRCFEGPGRLPAPVWESVYFSGDPSLFQESTLRVRNAYRAAGFIPAQYPHVADDHVAIELDFMRALAQLAVAAQEGSREQAAALATSKAFLDQHLGRWAGMYAQRLEDAGANWFYAAAARALCSFVEHDRDVLLKAADGE